MFEFSFIEIKCIFLFLDKILLLFFILENDFKKSGYDVIGGYCNWIHINSKDDNKILCSILDEYSDVTYKAGAKIPFDDRTNWLRMTIGPTLHKQKFIKKILGEI